MFKGLSQEKLKRVLNHLISIDLSDYTEFEFIESESSGITGHEEKGYVRSDVVLKFWQGNDRNNDKKAVIEFQTTPDKRMGERLYIYTSNHSKTYIKDGITYCEPAMGITIYSTFGVPLDGVDIVKVKETPHN